MASFSSLSHSHPLHQAYPFTSQLNTFSSETTAELDGASSSLTLSFGEGQSLEPFDSGGGDHRTSYYLGEGERHRSPAGNSSRGTGASSTGDDGIRASEGIEVKDGYIVHQVSRFDTLAGLAVKYGVQVEHLKRINRLTSDLQMFALGTVRIPLHGNLAGSTPPTPDAGVTTYSLPYDHQRTTSQESNPEDTVSGKQGAARRSAAAAAAVATGREAAAAAVQLVESMDPELLLGVKGLRSAAELDADSGGGVAQANGERGAKAVALLLALQKHNSRGSLVMDNNPLGRLTLSSSSEALDEDQQSWKDGLHARAGARSSMPGLHEQSQSRPRTGSFWEHEFRGEGESLGRRPGNQKLPGIPPGGRTVHAPASGTASIPLGDSSLAASVGLTAEKLTMRKRGLGTGPGREGGDDPQNPNPKYEQEGWFSADEAVLRGHSTRAWGSNTAGGGLEVPWSHAGRHPGYRERGGSGSYLRSSLHANSSGSNSFESLDTLNASASVAAAAQWGSRMFNDLVGQLRHSGGWLLERSAWDASHSHAGKALPASRSEVGIDLPVMTRAPGAAGGTPSVNYGAEATPLRDGAPRSVGTTFATVRRSSKGKAAMD